MNPNPFPTRNKTLRRGANTDLSGARVRVDYAVNENLQRLLDSEATTAYKKPWHRLERGLRINRLRQFCQDMMEKRQLKQAETDALFALLMKALDKKILNSKTTVLYDTETEKITEIKNLVMHQNAEGNVLFQLVEKRNAVTFRKKAGAAAPVEAEAEQQA
uniref:Uncharacterized protein n=1 Tax=viral metagenome TaxID=1070528 RepID=A0A6C0BCA7_9ZZZZ